MAEARPATHCCSALTASSSAPCVRSRDPGHALDGFEYFLGPNRLFEGATRAETQDASSAGNLESARGRAPPRSLQRADKAHSRALGQSSARQSQKKRLPGLGRPGCSLRSRHPRTFCDGEAGDRMAAITGTGNGAAAALSCTRRCNAGGCAGSEGGGRRFSSERPRWVSSCTLWQHEQCIQEPSWRHEDTQSRIAAPG